MGLHRIDSVDELRRYLQVALQLEHATIPPYMTALYSIHPNTNVEAVRTLQMVVLEEMLHTVLVANVLNALGGEPDFTVSGFVPHYPTHLPDGDEDFEVDIRAFSRRALETFLQIEQPSSVGDDPIFVDRLRSPRALLPAVHDDGDELHFFSIGEFYQEIERGLVQLARQYVTEGRELFVGDPARQVTSDFRYSGGGDIIAVNDLTSALTALRFICAQGEGLGGAIYDEDDELSHFYRFEEILIGRAYQPGDQPGSPSGASFDVDWDAVYPVLTNARISDFVEGSDLRRDALAYRERYQSFLGSLTVAFTGRPDTLDQAVGEMFELKELALRLIRTPLPNRDNVHAAPVYGYE